MDTDLSLIEAIQSGDETALETLIERHQTALYYFVYRYTGNEHAAREIVQETFVRTYFKARSFRPRSTVKTWLYTIALNLCRDAGRRRSRRPDFVSLGTMGSDGPGVEVADDAATADEQAARSEEFEKLQTAIQRLPSRLRVPLVLCALEQRSQKEAAEILSTTPKSIELRIHRAKRKLARMLGGRGDG